MSYQSQWYFSQIPEDITNTLEKELQEDNKIPENHWISGFIWHYVRRANRENFLYDLTGIDNTNLQYLQYKQGDGSAWNNDAGLEKQSGINNELIRKLSFSLQLSSHDDYEGGNIQFISDNTSTYYSPRKRGTIVLFDSRAQHRVHKVTSGTRKFISGYALGPNFR